MQAEAVREAVAGLRDAFDVLAACDVDLLDCDELLPVMDELEVLGRRVPSQWQRMLARLQAETTPRGMGAKTWNEVLRVRWRLSAGEAGRRLAEAADLEPRHTVTGECVAPALPAVAAARAAGVITAEHVKVLRETMDDVPAWVDRATRAQIEVDLVRGAAGVGPKELRDTAALRLFLLDQDGPEPDDTERDRRRGVSIGRQGRDGMTPLTAHLSPEAAAVWEVLFARFAAPGMCNPADPEPCTAGTPTRAQIDADDRSLAQRRHDALLVVGRIALMTDLGQLNGLPVSIVIRTTLQDLQSRAGVAITGGGTRLTMGDLDRLGGHAAYHLAVFDEATGSALNHFRAKRVATPAQRIMMFAKYGGCSKPGCTVGFYGCQAHHATADWADGGVTNIDDLAPACGPDNRMVDDGGWTTRMNDRGDCEWIPPQRLDTGQPRVNTHHRPELLLTPPDDDIDIDTVTDPPPEPVRDAAAEPFPPLDDAPLPRPQPVWDDTTEPFPPLQDAPPPPRPPVWDDTTDDSQPFNHWRSHDTSEPGGPAPPDNRAA